MAQEKNRSQKTAAIVLAAGESKRLGRPKQTVKYAGQTLLERTVTTVLSTSVDTVIVVLGANSSVCKHALLSYPIEIVINKKWREGISSSIRAGLEALEKPGQGNFDSAIFLTCDQPFLSAQLISELLAEYRSGNSLIVASAYSDCLGVPALISDKLFAEVSNLKGDSGAGILIKKYRDKNKSLVSRVTFENGEIDIDTTIDLIDLDAFGQDSVAQADTVTTQR